MSSPSARGGVSRAAVTFGWADGEEIEKPLRRKVMVGEVSFCRWSRMGDADLPQFVWIEDTLGREKPWFFIFLSVFSMDLASEKRM